MELELSKLDNMDDGGDSDSESASPEIQVQASVSAKVAKNGQQGFF